MVHGESNRWKICTEYGNDREYGVMGRQDQWEIRFIIMITRVSWPRMSLDIIKELLSTRKINEIIHLAFDLRYRC